MKITLSGSCATTGSANRKREKPSFLNKLSEFAYRHKEGALEQLFCGENFVSRQNPERPGTAQLEAYSIFGESTWDR
ncbi:hypothetical protein ABID26_003959 [Mesorhizobium shonense]|uniref:Uncharacterized protein n=1 Tax=Mesorhizobium shonense TaxID=1209948 RepID=A0ABV2HVC2_9HYPH|nr:hypothetical protein [Mesorhizobium sp.]TIS46270.1 MAG: hypothetical protein E5W96_28315 [Mesorhizobium sp.]